MPAIAAPPAAPVKPAVAPPTPPAPATAPTPAPPAPAPSPTPSAPTPAPPSQRTFKPGNFDDLDSLGDEPKPPLTPPAPGPTPPKPGVTGPAPTPDPTDKDVPEFKTNKELREWAKGRHSLAKELEKKYGDLERAHAEAQSQWEKGQPQTEELTKRIASYEKQVADYEAQLRLVNYRKSKEYQDNFEAPLNRAIDAAHREMGELDVQFTDAEGEVTTRQATAQDFNRVYNLPARDARKIAKEMFGDAANDVLAHVRKIRDLSDEASRKEQEYEKQGAEQEKQNQSRAQTEAEAAQRMFRQVNEDLATKYPQWFKEIDGDDKGNELLQKGFTLVDSAMGPARAQLSLQDRIIVDARIRNQAAGFMRQAHIIKSLQSELTEAKKVIEELRSSGPGAPGGAGGGPAGGDAPPKNWEEGFDKAMPH